VAAKVEDTRATDAARASPFDDKVRALKQYKHARGLCDRCAEKWAPRHKCADFVQLHAIQEIWELFSDTKDQVETSSEQTPQLFAYLSEAIVAGMESTMSMRL
jgi:inactivated superfamily I helicase